jgi:phenylacetate-CoA ligase
LNNKYLETINVYGSADIGAMASETPISILARELAIGNKKLFGDIFGGIEKTPTFAQFNPAFVSFEEDHGEIVLTGDNTIPLIRYAIGDNGGVISFADLKNKLKNNGIDLKKEASKAGIADQITELPFVYVYERKDLSTTIYGLNVFPEFIKDALLRPELTKYCTGKMAMCTKFNEEQDQYLEINVEMKKQVKSTVNLRHKIQKIVLDNLLKKSSEYRELYRFIGKRALPKIILWPAEDLTFFRPGIKQKWVIKP